MLVAPDDEVKEAVDEAFWNVRGRRVPDTMLEKRSKKSAKCWHFSAAASPTQISCYLPVLVNDKDVEPVLDVHGRPHKLQLPSDNGPVETFITYVSQSKDGKLGRALLHQQRLNRNFVGRL